MNLLAYLRGLPQPLRTFYACFLVAFLVTFVAFALSRAVGIDLVGWAFALLGLAAVLTGGTAALNVNGAADAMARQAAQRPRGVGSSPSVATKPGYARATGVLMVVVGVAFVVGGVAGS